MKRFLISIALLLGMSAFFTSCNKDNGGDTNSSSIYGLWYIDTFDIYLDNVKVDSYTRTKEGSGFPNRFKPEYFTPDEPGYFYFEEELENGTLVKNSFVSIFDNFVEYTYLIFDNGIKNGLGNDRAWREDNHEICTFETNYLANLKNGEEFMTFKSMFDETWLFTFNNGVIVQTNDEPLSGSTMTWVAGYVSSSGKDYYWGEKGTNPKFKIIVTYKPYKK